MSTRANGHLGQMSIWDKMSIEGMWALGQMDMGEMGTLKPMSIGASGHWGQMGS